MSKQMTVAIAGLGSRGRDTYAKVAKLCSDKMKIVAIADIDPEKVRLTAGEYGIPKARCYASAEEMLQEEKLADAMIIATQDRQHVEQAVAALGKVITCYWKNQSHRILQSAEGFPRWQKNVKEKWLSVMY